MTVRCVRINEVEVSAAAQEYVCFGLGSCVGVFVTDRLTGISGAAHVPLSVPQAPAFDEERFLDASTMLSDLLYRFKTLGSELTCLRAKLVGGAHVYETSPDIGMQNIQAITRILTERHIYLAGADVGGRLSRSARFNSVTGQLYISTSEKKSYFI
jgi:chemotaxis protein CheD